MDETILLDPTSQRQPVARQAAPPLADLSGATIALVDIAKPRGDVFLDGLAVLLTERGLGVERFRKPTHARVAPADLRRSVAERADAVVVALAD